MGKWKSGVRYKKQARKSYRTSLGHCLLKRLTLIQLPRLLRSHPSQRRRQNLVQQIHSIHCFYPKLLIIRSSVSACLTRSEPSLSGPATVVQLDIPAILRKTTILLK